MSILARLKEEGVVSFELRRDKRQLLVQECCDFYFESDLSKAEVKQLIDELTAIHEEMKGGEG